MNLKILKRRLLTKFNFRAKRKLNGSKDLRLVAVGRKNDEAKASRLRRLRLFFSGVYSSLFAKKFIRVILFLFLLGILFLLVRYFLFSEEFYVKNISITGYNFASQKTLEDELGKLYGKNIFLSRSSSIERSVVNLSPYIKEVKVYKDLPDTINVEIVERTPQFLWINLSGIYLLSGEGFVLEIVKDYDDLALSLEDTDLLKGYGNLSEVEEEKEGSEEEISEQDENGSKPESELSYEEKRRLIESQRLEVISKVEQFLSDNMGDIQEWYRQFNIIFSYFDAGYEIKASLSGETIENTNKGLGIEFGDEIVERYVWESEYRFLIYFEGRRKIIFSTKRDFDEQIKDLDLLLTEFKKDNKKFKVIDLSSEIVMYELAAK